MIETVEVTKRDIVKESLRAMAILGLIVGAYGFDIYMVIMLIRWIRGG